MPERRTLVVLWAAVAAAVYMAGVLVTAPPLDMMSSRAHGISESIAVLDHGGPPLLLSDVPYHAGVASQHLSAAGFTDDPGAYLYLPLLGHWTGESDPAVLMKWLFVAAFGLLVFVTALVFYALFGSVVAAIAVPVLLGWRFRIAYSDLYWAQPWILLLGLPLLMLVVRWWRAGRTRAVVAVLAPLAVAAGVATSIRAHSGLPIVVAALGIVLLTGRAWRARIAVAAIVAVAYASVGLAFTGVRAYRDSKVDLPPAIQTTSHPLWHPLYLGLGFLPNKYGIAWNDSVAADAVGRVHPEAPYLSAQYDDTLRGLYTTIVEDDPGFAARTYLTKTRIVLADAVRYFWLLPVLAALAIATGRTRGLRLALLLCLPAFALTLVSPVMTIPTLQYELGWLGAVGAAWLLALGWAAAWLEEGVTGGPLLARARNAWRVARWRRATLAAGAAVVAAAVAAVAASPAVPSDEGMYVSGASPYAPTVHGTTTAAWRFGGRPAHGWTAAAGAQLEPDRAETDEIGLHVITTTIDDAPQLRARTATLSAGRYQLVGRVRVLAGGLGIHVTGAHDKPLGAGHYWWRQGDFVHNRVGTSFTLAKPTAVSITLRNWTTLEAASSWVLWNFRLVHVS